MTSAQRFRVLLVAFSLTTLLALGAYWYRLDTTYQQMRVNALARTEVVAEQLAGGVSEQMNAVVQGVDYIIRSLRNEYLEERHSFDLAVTSSFATLPPDALIQVAVIGADGYLSYSSLGEPGHVYLGDREHFLAHAESREDRLFVSKPVLGRVSKTWTVQFSRPILKAGKFAGVLVLSISPQYLSRTLAALGLGPNDSAALLSHDGNFLARSVRIEEYLGKAVRADRPYLQAEAAETGVFHDQASLEPIRRTFAWHRLPAHSLMVYIGLAEADILAPVEAQIRGSQKTNLIGSTLVLCLLLAVVSLLYREERQRRRLAANEARYRGLFEAVPDGMILVDPARRITLCNSASQDILGVDEEGLKNRRVHLRYKDGTPVAEEDYPTRRALDFPRTEGLYTIAAADGRLKWIVVNSRQLPEAGGAVVSFSDITRLVALEESLLISQSVFDAAAEGIMVTGPDNRILRVNPAFTRITGYAVDEAIGQTPALLASGHHDKAFFQAMYQALAEKGRWEGEITNRRKDGRIFVERLKISSVKTPEGALLRYVALLSDITVKKRQEREIWHQAHYDPLTELPNRTLFVDRLAQALALAKRRGQHVGLLFIDLDKFKPVNDTYGHQVGDELLRQVARRIVNATREEDTVARLGGDEFVVLLPVVDDADDCLKVSNKILESLIQPFRLGEVIAEISASIGLALSPEDGDDAATLLQRADAAMYQAKASGRHTIRRAAPATEPARRES